MNKKQRNNLIRIIVSAGLLVGLHFVPLTGPLRFVCYMVPYLIVGYDILIKAGKGIKNRQPLDECLLMVIATLGAIAIAVLDSGDYTEAVAVMLFYQIGEWFQSYAIGKSRKNISELMDIRPDYANVRDESGSLSQIDPDEVEIGTVIICNPGEKIPIDGIVVKGTSTLDTAALTGESVPRSIKEGEEVISGCINMTGVIEIETTKEFGESTASKILDLVENASSRKSKSEDFISRFARIYTPVVVGCAVALAILPPVVRAMIGAEPLWTMWLYRALIFLVISCPCALVISIPLSFFGGIGGAGRAGVLVKGSNYLELLSKTKTLVCDKTGTLTEGVFKVTGIHPATEDSGSGSADGGRNSLLRYAALAEAASSHPIAKSLVAAYEASKIGDIAPTEIDHNAQSSSGCIDVDATEIQEISGKGIRAIIDGKTVFVGNEKLMVDAGVAFDEVTEYGTIIYVAVDGAYAGHIVISDEIKESAKSAISEIKTAGVNRIVMLTGDHRSVAEHVGKELGISEIESELLPADKVSFVEKLIKEKQRPEEVLAFVGDGINDAPVLARADIGIAMGAMGSDAAIEAADVVLMDDNPLKIAKAIRISKKCLRIVKENICFAIGVKVICLILGALGIANMWLAIFADVGVMVIAVLNAIRALFVRKV